MAPFQHEDYLRLTGLGEPGEILNLLVQLSQKTKHDIKFFNYYKEVPVSAPVEFLYVFGETLACRSSDPQKQAIKNCRYTLIRSPKLPQDVYATATLNEATNEIILSDFAYVELLPERRTTLRVKIGGLFRVTVEAGSDSFIAKLKDISIGGCALEIPKRTLLGKFTYFYINFVFDLKIALSRNRCA